MTFAIWSDEEKQFNRNGYKLRCTYTYLFSRMFRQRVTLQSDKQTDMHVIQH